MTVTLSQVVAGVACFYALCALILTARYMRRR